MVRKQIVTRGHSTAADRILKKFWQDMAPFISGKPELRNALRTIYLCIIYILVTQTFHLLG